MLGALVAALGAAAGFRDRGPARGGLSARTALVPFTAPTGAATTGVVRLRGAGARRSKDIRPPLAFALPGLGKRGRRTALKYLAFDDSGRVGVVIQVLAGRHALATLRLPLRSGSPTQTSYVAWRVPLRPPSPQLQFCVTPTDPSGNRGRRSCAPIKAV